MTQQCDGSGEAAVMVCQAYQAGWDDGFLAGQREGAAVALHTDTVTVWRREPPPADVIVMWSGLFMVLGGVVARFWPQRRD